jgi:hypothetical protein
VSLAILVLETLWKAVAPELCLAEKSGSLPEQFAGSLGRCPVFRQ